MNKYEFLILEYLFKVYEDKGFFPANVGGWIKTNRIADDLNILETGVAKCCNYLYEKGFILAESKYANFLTSQLLVRISVEGIEHLMKLKTQLSNELNLKNNYTKVAQQPYTKKHKSEIPKSFICYSWDNEEHKDWVRKLASDLTSNGVHVILDQWDLHPGANLPAFMESSIRELDYVLLICTPPFAKKANELSGGVGYEKTIVTGEMYTKTASPRKFVPLIREGDQRNSLPSYLKSKLYIDFRDDSQYENSLEELLRHIFQSPKHKRPEIGEKPSLESIDEMQKKYSALSSKQKKLLQWKNENQILTIRTKGKKLGKSTNVDSVYSETHEGFIAKCDEFSVTFKTAKGYFLNEPLDNILIGEDTKKYRPLIIVGWSLGK